MILSGLKAQRAAVPWLVGLYITAAYWFTASTAFALVALIVAGWLWADAPRKEHL